MRAALTLVLGAALGAPACALGQNAHAVPGDPAIQAFVDSARAGTARYGDRDAAIADGYRAIGPDAPGMGQHMVNPTLLLRGVLDPAKPQVLTYIVVDRRAVLAGVAYAIPSHGVSNVPPTPMGTDAWHFHAGTIDEEGFLFDHHHAGTGPGSDTRLAVLHAWIWSANPAGTFEPDNWALPFLRLGFTPPPAADAGAGRALALATVGEPFFLKMIRETGGADSAALRRVGELLRTHAASVRAWAEERRGRSLDASDAAWLASNWAQLWNEVRGAVPQETWSRLGGEAAGRNLP